MAHWLPGKVIVPKENIDSPLKRYFRNYDVAWIITRHNDFIYFKIRWQAGDELITRCAEDEMHKYFSIVVIHDEMPYFKGALRDIKIFPDELVYKK